MDPKDFDGRAGTVTPGWEDGKAFPTFTPNNLPVEIDISKKMGKLLEQANRSLGILNGFKRSQYEELTPFLISLYIRKEAVSSSKIEGTKSSLNDVVEAEAKERLGQKGVDEDAKQVINYSKALKAGLELIKTSELNTELLLKLHKILLSGVRGSGKNPGEIRTSQNFIGKDETTPISEATYVPPTPDKVVSLLDNLFYYLNEDNETPDLIKIALAHYQFEAIHPFRDGNGRLGRLLIILYLSKKGLLELPTIYVSGFFERYRTEYYEKLLAVSKTADYVSWVNFFLMGVLTQANDAVKRALELRSYFEQEKHKIKNKRVLDVFEYLFSEPVISTTEIAKFLVVTYPTAKEIVEKLLKIDILKPIASRKEKLFAAKGIIDIVSG